MCRRSRSESGRRTMSAPVDMPQNGRTKRSVPYQLTGNGRTARRRAQTLPAMPYTRREKRAIDARPIARLSTCMAKIPLKFDELIDGEALRRDLTRLTDGSDGDGSSASTRAAVLQLLK